MPGHRHFSKRRQNGVQKAIFRSVKGGLWQGERRSFETPVVTRCVPASYRQPPKSAAKGVAEGLIKNVKRGRLHRNVKLNCYICTLFIYSR